MPKKVKVPNNLPSLDIIERKGMEEELREPETELKNILENMHDGILEDITERKRAREGQDEV